MKNLIKLFYLSIFLIISFSCKKEVIEKPDNNIVTPTGEDTLIGFNWVLTEGRLYLQNMDNGNKSYYDHFGINKNVSTLKPFGGSNILFDNITKNVTTWNFSNTAFTLDNSNFYEVNGTTSTISVFGLEDGSSRSIIVMELLDDKLTVKVCEGYASSNGVNYQYFSTLTFVKQGTSCTNCQPNVLFGYTYGGLFSDVIETSDLVNTKWVVTKFYDGFSNNYPNDTIFFVNTNKYTINGGVQKNYTINSIVGNNMSELTLYGFYTIGGDYSGMVPNTFVTDGQINSISFTDIFNTNNNKLVWMTRIQ
jgi:hypothetical protein